jgi:hypothetical protein
MITELEWWSNYADITCKTWARETYPTSTLSKENKAIAFQKKRQQHWAQCFFKYLESPMCFLKLTHGSTHIVLLKNICSDRKTKASSWVHICSCISHSNLRLEASLWIVEDKKGGWKYSNSYDKYFLFGNVLK